MSFFRHFTLCLCALCGCSAQQGDEQIESLVMTNFWSATFRVEGKEYQCVHIEEVTMPSPGRSIVWISPRIESIDKGYVGASVDKASILLCFMQGETAQMIEAEWSNIYFLSDWNGDPQNLFVKKSFAEAGINDKMKNLKDMAAVIETMIRENLPKNEEVEE